MTTRTGAGSLATQGERTSSPYSPFSPASTLSAAAKKASGYRGPRYLVAGSLPLLSR